MARCEEFVVWQKAMVVSAEIREIAKSITDDAELADQLLRAALSVPANIGEGCERGSDADFRRFLFYARASCGELVSHMRFALIDGHVDADRHRVLMSDLKQVERMIGKLIWRLEPR